MSTPGEEGAHEELRAHLRAKRRKGIAWFVGGATVFVILWIALGRAAGLGSATDGTPAVARINAVRDGRCMVGVRHSRCYHLDLEVLPVEGPPFPSALDVNIEDRWAFRVQVGSRVRVLRDRKQPDKVYLDTQALANPPP